MAKAIAAKDARFLSEKLSVPLRCRRGWWMVLATVHGRVLAVCGHDRRLVAWLIVTGRVRPTAEYLVASKLRVGRVAAGIYREFHGRFLEVAGELGFDPKSSTTATRSKASKGSTRNSSNESAPICPIMDRSASAGQTLGKSEPSL